MASQSSQKVLKRHKNIYFKAVVDYSLGKSKIDSGKNFKTQLALRLLYKPQMSGSAEIQVSEFFENINIVAL